MRLGFLGCGVVAEKYAAALKGKFTFAEAWDTDAARLKFFCNLTGSRPCSSQNAFLESKRSDAVLILTYPDTHEGLTRAALLAGKHVFCEKPMAFSADHTDQLFELATAQQRVLQSAPGINLGAAQKKVHSLIEADTVGQVRIAYAEANHWRLEKRHPRPMPIMELGVLWDQGPYLLTLLTNWLGKLTVQSAWGDVLIPQRADSDGHQARLSAPDFVTALLQNEQGVTCRLTLNFIAGGSRQGSNVELIGDSGAIWMEHFQDYASPIQLTISGQSNEVTVDDLDGYCYGRSVELFAKQISEGLTCSTHRQQVTHVISLLETIDKTIRLQSTTPLGQSSA